MTECIFGVLFYPKEKSTHWLTNHKHKLRLYNILIQVYRFADENTVLHTIKTIKQFRL